MKDTRQLTRLEKAFLQVKREQFLPDTKKPLASYDGPLEIGYGQTNSQPLTVKRMLGWLDVIPGQKILDVGSGSGWTSALLAWLTGPEGAVFAVERIEDIRYFGEHNCAQFGCQNVRFFPAGEELGLIQHAPFDRILVSAAARTDIPLPLLDQLACGGKLVIPVDNSIFELKKAAQGTANGYRHEHFGYSFVPLIY